LGYGATRVAARAVVLRIPARVGSAAS